MDTKTLLNNSCGNEKDFCMNCNSHFMSLRPLLKDIIISKHFKRDLKDEEEINSLIKNILECSHLEFNELHKFEENIYGNMIFRAKKQSLHVVYAVDKNRKLVFLRAFKNYGEYSKFLEDKKEIKTLISHV
jgi:mRNA-degrading endonuclease RelE of RelBE toxin-antitoxin system